MFQPGSAISAHSSTGSSRSNRARTRQYRTVSHKSQVDESLFGQTNKPAKNRNNSHIVEEEDIFTAPPQRKSGTRKPKKETVQVITKDLIRNLM